MGEICHIKAQSEGGPRFDPNLSTDKLHAEENLILLCAPHHKVIDADAAAYDVAILRDIKASHTDGVLPHQFDSEGLFCKLLLNKAEVGISVSENSGNVAINSSNVTQGQVVNIRASTGRVKVEPPSGTIGAVPDFVSYIEYLIKRYNEFASKNKSRPFHYGAIAKNLETKFGSKWRLVQDTRFQEVTEYLVGRIEKTQQAKLNRSRGYRRFSTFEDHVSKRRGKPDSE